MASSGSKLRSVLLDLLERAGWSAGQVFFATLLAGGAAVSAANLPWRYSSTIALSAAVSSVILTLVQYLVRATNLPFWPDMLVRLGKTFLASVAASIAAAQVFDMTKFGWTAALNVAALATITALGKGLLARGQAPAATASGTASVAAPRRSPSTLPASTYTEAISR
jgi:hypothetical protein